jgi:photosystem II stability/assembly factor-like uncharacterized protein
MAQLVLNDIDQETAAVLLPREGGILITCDAVQNWTHVDTVAADGALPRDARSGARN